MRINIPSLAFRDEKPAPPDITADFPGVTLPEGVRYNGVFDTGLFDHLAEFTDIDPSSPSYRASFNIWKREVHTNTVRIHHMRKRAEFTRPAWESSAQP